MIPTDNNQTDADANSIVAYLLEENRLALLSGDFARFEPNFGLPYTLETFEGREVVTTRAALERLFLNSVSYYKEIGVTDLVRRPLHSAFRDETTLNTTYETQLIHFDRVLQRQPYFVYSEVILQDGIWRCISSQYAIADSALHGRTLLDKA